MSKFLVNKSNAKVSLLGGQVLIKVGGFVEVSDAQAEDSDVIMSKNRGWIEVSATQPTGSSDGVPARVIETDNDKFKGSTTFPGKEKKEEVVKEGPPETPVVAEEPAVEVKEEVKTETKAGGRKASK